MRTLPLPEVTPGSASPPTLSSGAPTGSNCPASPCSADTTPANGTGTSTAAFAVSTSTTTWSTSTVSPTSTRQSTMAASVRPSPRSGSRKSGTGHHRSVVPLQPGDRVEDPVDVRQLVALELRRRVRDVEAGHPQHGRVQLVEALLGDARDDLGAVAAEARGFVNHHSPPGVAHGSRHGLVVER